MESKNASVEERKMSEKNAKYSGFRLYIRKHGSAYDSSIWKLDSSSQGAAASSLQTNQSGDYRTGGQGLVASHTPGLNTAD